MQFIVNIDFYKLGLLDKFQFCPVCGSNRFRDNDFKSRKCDDCGFTFYFNAAAACAAVITNERGELLVGVRAQEPQKGTLDLIGGFVDPGESSDQAILREIKEETDIDINTLLNEKKAEMTFLFSLPSTYVFSGLTIHTCDAFYHIRIPSDTLLQAHDDVESCFWAQPQDIHHEQFGLTSIKEAVKRFLNEE